MVSICGKLLADRIEMPIIFITGFGDVPLTIRAMKAGAVEFLTKPFDAAVLLSAIRLAHECTGARMLRNTHYQPDFACSTRRFAALRLAPAMMQHEVGAPL
jgi:FixJ family two-component response regulator